MKRKIIEINEAKCNGCGDCIPNCQEGALQIIDGKARLVSDLFCDGLGACVGHCPTGAMRVVEREAEPYDERRTMEEKLIPQGINTVRAHLAHLKEHGESELYQIALDVAREHGLDLESAAPEPAKPSACGCPGGLSRTFERGRAPDASGAAAVPSELRQWPVQLALVNPAAGFFDGADLLVSADCVPFAYGNFHRELLQGKVVINFCPKLDGDSEKYVTKLAEILRLHAIASVTIVRMEVPCCGGTETIVRQAIDRAGSCIKPEIKIISLDGRVLPQ